jgi:hypothetical protein
MAFPYRKVSVTGGSGTLTAAPVAGTTTAGTAVNLSDVVPGTLSCLFNLLAETNTITLTGKFQVSNDNSTWYDLAGDAQNPANVAQCTGTAGADTAVARVLPVPPSAIGWNWIRAAVVNAVATGAAGDTYAFTFQYIKNTGF